MVNYHVKEDGEIGICKVQPDSGRTCPVGVYHSDDKEEVVYQSEVILAKKNETFKQPFNYKKMVVLVNENFSFPNVSNYENLPKILKLIQDGKNTHASFAEGTNTVDRHGRYYGNAIGYLNLADYTKGDNNEYNYYLTETGKELMKLPPKKQKKMLDAMVNNIPVIKEFREKGDAGAVDYLMKTHGFSKKMAESRIVVIKRWDNLVEDKDLILESKSEMITHDFKTPVKKHNVESNNFCNVCFTQKALDGSCLCDD